MGFVSTSDEFCRRMDNALEGVKDCTKVVDDLLVRSETYEEHLERVREILLRLRRHRIPVNRKKFVFATPTAHFWGYNISKDGVSVDPAKVQAVGDFPIPTTLREIRSFLAFLTSLLIFPPRSLVQLKHYESFSAPRRNLSGLQPTRCLSKQ